MIKAVETTNEKEILALFDDPILRDKTTSDEVFKANMAVRRYIFCYDEEYLCGAFWFKRFNNMTAEVHALMKPKREGEGSRIKNIFSAFETWMVGNTKFLKMVTFIPAETCAKTVYCAVHCGMVYEGLLTNSIFFNDTLQDSSMLGKSLDRGF